MSKLSLLIASLVGFAVASTAAAQTYRGTPGQAVARAMVTVDPAVHNIGAAARARSGGAVAPDVRGGSNRLPVEAAGAANGRAARLAEADALPPSPPLAASFRAGSDSDWIPPDVSGAVGPNHLVVAHNGLFLVQDRTGNVLLEWWRIDFWWTVGPLPEAPFDPKVLYDPLAGRWVITSVVGRTGASSRVLIGV